MKSIILASGSPRRAELLRQIGISFEVISSDKEEPAPISQMPEDFVVKTASFKGENVLSELLKDRCNLNKIVVAADTAGAAKLVSEWQSKEDAAIASNLAAKKYDLQISFRKLLNVKYLIPIFASQT